MRGFVGPVVILSLDEFKKILMSMREKTIIKMFAEDEDMANNWRKLTKEEVISRVWIENEKQI